MAVFQLVAPRRPIYSIFHLGGGYGERALLLISALCMLTMSSSAVMLFDIPRITILSIPFTVYMYLRIAGRINIKLLQFAIIYLVAFFPGTLAATLEGNVKILSAVQLIFAIITFVVLGSYFLEWVYRRGELEKRMELEFIIIFFLVFSVIELMFYGQFSNLRGIFYRTSFADAVGHISMRRELMLYGGRPTGFFSESSHFARYMSLIVAAYMVVTRCSWRSLVALVVCMFTLKSLSYFFAAPAMLLALLQPSSKVIALGRRVVRHRQWNIFIAAAACAAIGLGVAVTQSQRTANLSPTGDGSFNGRILYPATYLMTEDTSPLLGMGLTPQDSVQEFTLRMKVARDHVAMVSGYGEGISASIVMLAGLGLLGLVIFIGGMYLLQGWDGVLLLGAFLASNMISSGYNSVTSLVPSALLLSLLIYQRSLGKLA